MHHVEDCNKSEKRLNENHLLLSNTVSTCDGLVKYISPHLASEQPVTLLLISDTGWGIFIMTKVCSKCKETKPVAEYYKRSASKDGLMYQCKTCKNKTSIKYQQTDAYKQYKAEHDSNNPRGPRKEYHREYRRNKYNSDNEYKLKTDLRRRLHGALNGKCKADTTKALLGCTYEEACAHIEAQFTEGMSWDKMGIHGIHIDHIRPCASFDLTDPEQQRECFHYTNLQPLWAEDNLRKSDKW